MRINDLLAPDPIRLPEDPAAGLDPGATATLLAHPDSPIAWATRAERALDEAETEEERILAYALARTGYHRGLDRLRAGGWKGWGPVPYSHEPNRGVLRSIAALARAAALIGEDAERDRCREMLRDADPEAAEALL